MSLSPSRSASLRREPALRDRSTITIARANGGNQNKHLGGGSVFGRQARKADVRVTDSRQNLHQKEQNRTELLAKQSQADWSQFDTRKERRNTKKTFKREWVVANKDVKTAKHLLRNSNSKRNDSYRAERKAEKRSERRDGVTLHHRGGRSNQGRHDRHYPVKKNRHHGYGGRYRYGRHYGYGGHYNDNHFSLSFRYGSPWYDHYSYPWRPYYRPYYYYPSSVIYQPVTVGYPVVAAPVIDSYADCDPAYYDTNGYYDAAYEDGIGGGTPLYQPGVGLGVGYAAEVDVAPAVGVVGVGTDGVYLGFWRNWYSPYTYYRTSYHWDRFRHYWSNYYWPHTFYGRLSAHISF